MGALGRSAVRRPLPFGREHESEADHVGLIYMARAGYDPESIRFWQGWNRAGAQPRASLQSSSHGHRIQQLQLMPQAARGSAKRCKTDRV
jgi:predicted Zn-dependent protease